MARYAAALLGGGANEHGSVLRPETLARMFEPHYQPDPWLPGMGLAFFCDEVGGHRTVGHDGIWTGFRSDMALAPDVGVGVLAFANTGWFDPRGAGVPVANALLRQLLDLPDDAVSTGVLTDPQPRMALGAGLEVVVHRNHLTIRGQMPIPAVRRGLRLCPDGDDPYAFRLDLSALGPGTTRLVFSRGPNGEVTALQLGLGSMSLQKRPHARNPRLWVNGALLAGATALAVRRFRNS